MTVIIVGAGIAGLSAGYHLKQINIKPILLEKESEYGGLCRSKVIGDAIFDYGVHVSFTQDDYVKKIFEQSVSKEFVEHTAVPCNYWHGFWIPHQPQNHLSYLPKPTIKKILIDFISLNTTKKKRLIIIGIGAIINLEIFLQKILRIFILKNFGPLIQKI